MRFLILLLINSILFGCSKESSPPPVISVDMSLVDADAAVIIKALLEEASTSTEWHKLGMYYQAHGFDEAAIQSYEYSIFLEPNSDVSYLLGIAFANLGFYDQAIEVISPITNYIPALWKQGIWQLDLGNFNEAEYLFKKAISTDPTTVAAIVGLARTHLAQGKANDAILALEDLLQRGGNHPYVLYLLGTAHQQAGHPRIAKQLLSSTVNGQPTWDDPLVTNMRTYQRGFAAELGRAVRKIDEGNLQGALNDLKRIESTYPYTPDVQTNLATTQLQLGKLNDAIQTLGAAIRKSPDYAPLHLTMGFAMSQAGETQRAIDFATTALSLQPSMVMATSFIGKMAMKQKKFPLAIQSFVRALELGDSDLRTRELLAELYLRSGRWEDAGRQYAIVLQISPQRTASIGGLSVALANSGQKDRAIQILATALQQTPNDQNLLRARNAIQNVEQPR